MFTESQPALIDLDPSALQAGEKRREAEIQPTLLGQHQADSKQGLTVEQRPDCIHMVDLFAGPGGLDVAAHWLGLKADGIEVDANAKETREKANLGTVWADVRKHGPEEFFDSGEFRILAGGPPCQTYTVAGSGAGRRALSEVLAMVEAMSPVANESVDDRKSRKKELQEKLSNIGDERTGLVLEPLRWALEAHEKGKPYDAIVLEQVQTVLPVWEAMKAVLEKLGYHAVCGILHTEEFGVPQTRRRAVLIARMGCRPSLPRPTHRRYRKKKENDSPSEENTLLDAAMLKGAVRSSEVDGIKETVTMADALRPHGRKQKFVVISNYGTGGDPKARGERRFDEPAATITGKVSRNRLVYLNSRRDIRGGNRFSLAEAGALQTFPYDYPWAGKDQAQQIGNAIPPRLAAHILAAALGWELDQDALDAAVMGKWEETRKSHPLAPKIDHPES